MITSSWRIVSLWAIALIWLPRVALGMRLINMRNEDRKRTVIITGANSGIGLAATKLLASTDEWNVVMACRSKAKAANAIRGFPVESQKNIDIRELDLADFTSIREFSKNWGDRPLDVLACNAGLQRSKGSGFGGPEDGVAVTRTKQGFEETIGVNHIGHFLLTQLLLRNVKEASNSNGGGRVVFVGSGVHNPEEPGGDVGSKAGLGDLQGLVQGFKAPIAMIDGGEYDPDKAYKDSKLCNVITSLELARRLQQQGSSSREIRTTSNVMNPGLIPTTGLFRDLNPIFVWIFTLLTRYVFKVAVTEEEGGRRLAYMISNPALNGITGAYFSGKPGADEFTPIPVSKEAMDQKKAERLWALTEKLIANNS